MSLERDDNSAKLTKSTPTFARFSGGDIKQGPAFRHFLTALLFAVLAWGLLTTPSPAKSSGLEGPPQVRELASVNPAQPGSNEFCLECHQTEDTFELLPSGEALALTVSGDELAHSIHGQEGLACTDCHGDYSSYPHEAQEYANLREFVGSQNAACLDCHEEERGAYFAGVHHTAVEEGNINAAYCSDCHGSHDTEAQSELGINAAQMCADCHAPVYELYAQSVHGEALLNEDNPDVPSCLDCHGAHEIKSAATAEFHLLSPQLCATCHADPELTEKYDLNPNVFDTYVADFHGTTVLLFEQVSPDQETNKPVCVDCHGVHNIRSSDDPESRTVRENLLATCQRCHPGASDEFPDAWLSHYQPSWEQTPIVSAVDLFYQLVIPGTVIGMLAFVVPDGVRMLRKRVGRKSDE